MRPWIQRFAVSLGALVVTAVAAEALMFFFGPPLVHYRRPQFRDLEGRPLDDIENIISFLSPTADWERVPPASNLRPNYRFRMCYDRPKGAQFDRDGCVEVSLNRFGFRDDEFPLEKPAGEYRVLTIGDSFTFGVGVRNDQCWPQVLERRLTGLHDGPVQVINGGWASGYNPALYAQWVPTDGLAFDPDLVIVGFCLNDMHRNVPMMSVKPVPERPYWGGTRRTPFVVLRRLYEQRRLDALQRLDWSLLVQRFSEQWQATQAGLLTIRDACRARGVRFLVAVFPMLSDLDRTYSYRGLHDMVRAFCAAEDIECVDLMDRFLGLDGESLWVHPTDQHPGPEGQAMLAEGIFDYLQHHR